MTWAMTDERRQYQWAMDILRAGDERRALERQPVSVRTQFYVLAVVIGCSIAVVVFAGCQGGQLRVMSVEATRWPLFMMLIGWVQEFIAATFRIHWLANVLRDLCTFSVAKA